jgi:hypothetical protein
LVKAFPHEVGINPDVNLAFQTNCKNLNQKIEAKFNTYLPKEEDDLFNMSSAAGLSVGGGVSVGGSVGGSTMQKTDW